jgi:toxin ParE1/3/4
MRSRCVWTRTALRGISRAYDYIFDFNPHGAALLASALVAAADSLAAFPHRGRLLRDTPLRELVVIAPYIIRYHLDGEEAVILRIRHTRKQPQKRKSLPLADNP